MPSLRMNPSHIQLAKDAALLALRSFPALLVLLSVPAFLACQSPGDGASTDYLAQPRPGAHPTIFAQGIVSTEGGMYGTVVFSPGQDEAFWVKDEEPGLFRSRLVAGAWTSPEELPVLDGYRINSPVFSFDGSRLYFLAARRGSGGMDTDDRIWVVDRGAAGWGEARELDTAVNSVRKHFQFSVDATGGVYFGGEGADLYYAACRDGVYQQPVRLSPPINTDAPETSPEISPDGSILLFDRWFETAPHVRIMASFRSPDGSWGEPVDLSPFTRSEGNDSGARLSRDGRYLFFQSVRDGSDANRSVYWMEAGFLGDLRAREGLEAGSSQEVPLPPPYLGESPPGSIPEPFAHYFITRELHSSPVFSPGGDLVFWTEMEGGGIQYSEGVDGRWSEPRVAPFSLQYSGEPVFGPHGESLYFLSAQRSSESQEGHDENLWKVSRTEDGWSTPVSVGSPINDQPMHWGVSFAADGSLYIGGGDGDGEIYVSAFTNGRYQEPTPLGPEVNSADMETTPEVAPDGSYLVFSRVVDHGRGPIDLYVSFRRGDGGWGAAIPLAGVNTPEREISPRLSPDGDYLFFLRTVNGELRPFWVSTRIIRELQPGF